MKAEYIKTINKFNTKKILVLGDIMLDIYLKGTSTRLSPEAPVPVVDVVDKNMVPGGAANTAMNLKGLGAHVTFFSVLGNDEEGEKAIQMLDAAGIDTQNMLRCADRKTITKTRIMVGSHVITRYDYGTETQIDDATEEALIQRLKSLYRQYDGILVSDYNKGVITDRVISSLGTLQEKYHKFLAVDSKRLTAFRSLRPSLAKPNYEEVVKLLKLQPVVSGRADQIQRSGSSLTSVTGADLVAVTLDEEGSVLFQKNKCIARVCAAPVHDPNVAGAGDTFISAFLLACVSGGSPDNAAALSSAAAAIAIRKDGTAACKLQELIGYFAMGEKQVYSLEELTQLCALYKSQGKKIVFTNGCFDILHSGHVSYLNRARQLGDILIVGLNTDESIRRLKGETRPINGLNDRMQVLAGLSSIDHIIAFGEVRDDTPVPLIKVVRPDIFVKGGDYTRDKLPEADTIEEIGGEIVFLSLVADHSTTHIIQQIYKTSTLAVA